jgi:hypothetical protein
MRGFDTKKSLQQLERFDYGKPEREDTYLVKTCIKLARTPLDKFTIGDLHLMIGQRFGLEFLIPLAIERLQPDALIEARFYPGDLLVNVLQVESQFWHEHPEWRLEVARLAKQAITSFASRPDVARKTTTRTLSRVYHDFQNQKDEA